MLPSPSAPAGNPIDVISGNKHQREADLEALPGVLGLELVRHYNSAQSHRGVALGRGWRLSYEAELRVGSNALAIVQADGATLTFVRGMLEPDRYSHPDPLRGSVQRHLTAAREPYHVWRWPDGRELRFEGRRLVQIAAPSGEFVSLLHAPNGELVRVRDPQGRELSIRYDKRGRVHAIDTPVGQYRYAYDEKHPNRLVKVALPGEPRVSRLYHHDDSRHPHHLTGISVESARSDAAPAIRRLATWGYDERGWAVASVKGDGKDDIERVGIERKTTAGGGEATLTNSLGHKTVYRWRVIDSQPRLLEAIGPGCASCGETDLRYGYDKQGRLVETTKVGEGGRPLHTTRHTLDWAGRIVRTVRIEHVGDKPHHERLQVRYAYPPAPAITPTLIARPSVIAGKEHTLRIAYNEAGQPTRITEEGYSPVDEQGQPAPAGAPISRTTTYAYGRINGRSLFTQVDGPLPNGPAGTPEDSDITRLHYDERGNHVIATTYPLNLRATFSHDEAGRLSAYTPIDGVPVQQSLNPLGQPIKLQRGGATVTITWDAAGRPSRVERNDGSSVGAVYDTAGRLIAVTDAQGSRREVERDSDGRILKTLWRDAAGEVPFEPLRVEYDDRGRPIANSRGLRLAYDPLGRLAATRDVLQREQRFVYDHHGRLGAMEQHVPQDAPMLLRTALSGGDTTLTRLLYRGDDMHASGVVAANGARTEHDVDDFGRTVRQTSPDTGTTSIRYDAADRPVERADAAGNRTEFAYDPLGRLVSRTHRGADAQADAARWRYDGAYLVQVDNAHQRERYRWEHGRLVEQTTVLVRSDGGEHVFVSRYRHDALGRLVEKRLPDGLRLEQGYEAQGQPARLVLRYPNGRTQVLVEGIDGSAARGLQEVRLGNGTISAYARDAKGRIAGVVTAAASSPGKAPRALYAQHIRYDEAGRIVGIERNGQTERYAYDGLDRLVEVQSPHEHRRYAYDAVGNRTAVWEAPSRSGVNTTLLAAQRPQQSWAYQGESNRLLEIVREAAATAAQTRAVWRYDANGSPTQIADRSYHYGANGRLQAVAQSGAALARYRYNAAGERVAKHTAAGSAYYLYAQNKIVAEADEHGRITAHYVYLGHTPLVKIETAQDARAQGWSDVRASAWQRWVRWARTLTGGSSDEGDSPIVTAAARVLFVHADHLGTPRLATDVPQRIVWRATFEAFGAAAVQPDPDRDGHATQINLRLPGQYFDAETGTHYNYFRDYGPALGRYLQSDPIGIGGGLNTYAYTRANTLSGSDPLGLFTVYWGGAGLNGNYMDDQIAALRSAGIINVHRGVGSGGTILDVVHVNLFRYQIDSDFFRLPGGIRTTQCPEQVNLIGYSYGSLVAAQTAWYYANRGTVIDNLVLIGSPIDTDFLRNLRSHSNIRNVIVRDLGSLGDPIHAGMTQLELVGSLPTLARQQLSSDGHFHYAPDNEDGRLRRRGLAFELFHAGLR